MEYEVATNALAKQFLDDYLTEDMVHTHSR